MTTPHHRLGFIGAGKLAGSVMRGLIGASFCGPGDILASEPNEPARQKLHDETGIRVTADNAEVAASAEIILVAVKPSVVLPVLRELGEKLADRTVISLAAGIRLESMEAVAPARFMRAMTNTPSAVGAAATAIAPGARTTAADLGLARRMFGAIGTVVEVTDAQIDAVTALAGSGPAFVYSVIEALADGGVRVGLKAEDSLILATQTVLGAARLAQASGRPLAELISQVVTPGGTTAAGLAAMQKMKAGEGLAAAIEAATRRGEEMARESA